MNLFSSAQDTLQLLKLVPHQTFLWTNNLFARVKLQANLPCLLCVQKNPLYEATYSVLLPQGPTTQCHGIFPQGHQCYGLGVPPSPVSPGLYISKDPISKIDSILRHLSKDSIISSGGDTIQPITCNNFTQSPFRSLLY